MIGTLRAVVLDAPDVRRLAAFYTALGGWTEQYADDEWIALETGDGWRIAVQRSPGHVSPRWPDPAGHPFDLCLFSANQQTTLMGVMLDCPDARELSAFYAELLGKPVTYEGEGVAMIGEDGAQPVLFQQITGYHAPRWPDPAYPQQFHLDVTVGDVDAAEAAALKLGATSLSSGGMNWRVYADPAGKPFCLCWH